MYESFYKLSGRPFQLMPDPRLLFKSREHTRALAYLLYGLEQREGLVVITGDVGMGKTLLVQTLLGEPRTRNLSVGRIAMANLDAASVLPSVASAFGLAHKSRSKIELMDDLVGRLLQTQSRGALLIVDEAQACNLEALEELRAISNLQAHGRALVQVFLVGQTELRTTLAAPQMEHLRQRIIASHQLQSLGPDEVTEYIYHRLRAVGWRDAPVFEDAVFDLVHEWSAGVPRRINVLMDRFLLYGYLEQRETLGLEDLRVVIAEFNEEFKNEAASEPLVSPAPTPTPTPAEEDATSQGVDMDVLSKRLVALEKALIGALGQTKADDLLKRHTMRTDSREMLRAQMRIARLESLFSDLAANKQAVGKPARTAEDVEPTPMPSADPSVDVPVPDAVDVRPINSSAAAASENNDSGPDQSADPAFSEDSEEQWRRWRLFSRRQTSEH